MVSSIFVLRRGRTLYWHFAFLVRPAPGGSFLAVAGDHADPLFDPDNDVVRRAALQEGDAVFAAGGQNAVARPLHLRRERLARDRAVAERKAEVAGADLGKSEARHSDDLLAIGDAFRAFQLHAQKQFALRIERPGITALHVIFDRQAPDRRCGSFRAAPARADAEPFAAGGAALALRCAPRALQPRQWRGNVGIDPDRIMRIAAGFHEGPHRIGAFRLAQQDA